MPKLARSVWNELQGLSIQEIETIKKFEQESSGTLFISAAEILRKRGYIDEAIVIMEEGVKAYPKYNTARAALARDYYLKGLMNEAQHHISLVVETSIDNPMAQRLKLKIDLLFDRYKEVEERLNYIKSLFPDDDFTRILRVHASAQDWEGAKKLIITELSRFGVNWNQGELSSNSDSALNRLKESLVGDMAHFENHTAWEIPKENSKNMEFREGMAEHSLNKEEEIQLPEALRSGATLANIRGNPEKYFGLRGFKRVKARGFFEGAVLGREERTSIDFSTLAEIYVTQGLVAKALSIYERLARSNPKAPQFIKRAAELRDLLSSSELKSVSQKSNVECAPKREDSVSYEADNIDRNGGAVAADRSENPKTEIPQKVLKKIQVLEGLLKQIEKRKAALA